MQLRDEDFDHVNPGEPRILIPREGSYPAQFNGYESKHYGLWGEKLVFQWKVFTSKDKDAFTMLNRYYNLARDGGGRLKFGDFHDYRRDWVRANGGRLPMVRSKLPLSIFQEHLFLIEVVTVHYDNQRRPLSSTLHWSKISMVIRPLADDETWEGLPVQPLNSSE